MPDSFSQFLEAYSKSNQDIKNIIDSDSIGVFAESIQTDKTNSKQKRQIIVSISNRILDIYNDTSLVDTLDKAGINPENIEKAKAFVEDLLSSKKQPTVATINPVQTIEVTPAVAQADNAIEIKPIINPLRTMATDGKQVGYQSTEEPVYSSVQTAIINESKWGSDDGK